MRPTALVGILIALAVTGCTSSSGVSHNPRKDSFLACDHYRDVIVDASKGILTDEELREKLQEVYDDASIGTSRVRRAAQAMLRTVTLGDTNGLIRDANEMDKACSAAGH